MLRTVSFVFHSRQSGLGSRRHMQGPGNAYILQLLPSLGATAIGCALLTQGLHMLQPREHSPESDALGDIALSTY